MIEINLNLKVTLKQLIAHSRRVPFAAMILDEEGNIIFSNERLLRATGYALENVKHKPCSIILPNEQISGLYELFQEGSDENFPYINWMNQGKRISSSTFHILKCETDSKQVYHFLQLFDITQGDATHEQSLSLIQRFAGALISNINLGVLVIDVHFRLIELSDMACRILGFSREKVINQRVDYVFAAMPEERRLIQKTLLDGVAMKNLAFTWTNNQQRFDLLVDSNLLKNDAGEIVGAYVIFKDVTNLRSLEQQIQRNDRLAMIGQIAAGAAHEIRNPLTSIKGFLQVMKQTLYEKGMLKEKGFTEIMLTEIDRINDLVSEFLLLSKPRDIQFQMVDVSSVLKDMLPIIQTEAILHNVEVRNKINSTLPVVIADRELLKQVFLNLCKNGIEAMQEGGILTITSEVDEVDKKISIDIHDTGAGIPSYLVDKIFEPFFTTKDSGTGLGLPVCQRIIHDIGGTIRVATKGFGTTFSVVIPYHA